jgi:hypothetical protein
MGLMKNLSIIVQAEAPSIQALWDAISLDLAAARRAPSPALPAAGPWPAKPPAGCRPAPSRPANMPP